MSEPSSPEDEANRLQAEHFCVELHIAIGDIEQDLAKLRSILAKQVRRRAPAQLTRETQRLFREAVVKRGELARMLDAMGHRYPCSRHG